MTKTIYINSDTYIDESTPTTNYGTSQTMVVEGDSGISNYEKHSLINSDLSSENNSLVSAKLYLFCYNAIPNKTLTINRITSTWVETNVNWNTAPTKTATNAVSFTTGGTDDVWLEIDITNLIIDCINNTNYGLIIFDAAKLENDSAFRTRENPNSPYIIINYGNKYVDISSGSDSDSGDTWALAYLTVKKGIDNIPANAILHIAEGDYSAQAAIDLNKNLELLCEDYGGGNASPPLTVILPVTT